MDASMIKQKEILTRDNILQDIRALRLTIHDLILSLISMLLILLLFILLLDYDFFWLRLLLFSPMIIMIAYITAKSVLEFYHYYCARAGRFYIKKLGYLGGSYHMRADIFTLYFDDKKRFSIRENHQSYTWSNLYSLSAFGLAKTYSEIGDTFYVVMHGNQIVMVYNTKLFELKT